MRIPEAAVVAAAKALVWEQTHGCYTYRPDGHPKRDDNDRYADAHARAALEAAAPHMQQMVTTQEELDAMPLNSVILDREGLPLHKDDSDRVEEWCYGDNAVDVYLPAKVLFSG